MLLDLFLVFHTLADIYYHYSTYFVNKMESINTIPVSLHKNLADKLVSVILDTENRGAISTEETKKIIYLWRQDQLASPTGIETLLNAGVKIDGEAVYKILDDLGLKEVMTEVKVF